MPTVEIRIAGKGYRIACEPGQEPRVQELAKYVDKRLMEITSAVKGAHESVVGAMLLLMMADEIDEMKKDVERLRVQLNNVTGSFESGKATDMEKILSNTLNNVAQRIEKIAQKAANG